MKLSNKDEFLLLFKEDEFPTYEKFEDNIQSTNICIEDVISQTGNGGLFILCQNDSRCSIEYEVKGGHILVNVQSIKNLV